MMLGQGLKNNEKIGGYFIKISSKNLIIARI